ncbi:MAG: DUF5916 domain-containing protein [Bacteroidales bacterium]
MKAIIFLLSFLCIYGNKIDGQSGSIKATRSDNRPDLDGKLNDPVWQSAIPFTGFRMVEPEPGNDPTEKTEVRVIYTNDGIYFGFRCFDSEPGRITANTMDHDKSEEKNEDQISILIDPFQDKRSAYIFIVNPKGARSEGFASGEHYNLGWDGLWEARCRKDEEGWSGEVFISFKTISFNPKLSNWGLNIERYIARKQEVIRYSGISLNSFFSNPREAGLLEGISDIKQGMGVTFRPFGKISRLDIKTDDINPGIDLKGGFDVYKNITPNLVAAITVNTDFAEIEVDERKLNITRFPLYYPEKRTFFLEGSDIFEFGSTSSSTFLPFFSRRIGLLEGQQVPIKWGTKAFGKIGGTNLSLLDVQSDNTLLSPSSNMFAGRISRNIFDESKVGIIITNGSQSGERNTLAGADFRYKTSRLMGHNNFSVDLWGVKNWNEKNGGNKSGFGIKIDYPNDLIDAAIQYNFFGDSLNPGLGFLPRAGYHSLYTAASYMPRPEKGLTGRLIRQWFFELRLTNYWDLNGGLESMQLFTAPVNFRTESGEHIEFNIIPNREVLPFDFEVSDGVVIPEGDYSFTNYRFEINSASYRVAQVDFSYRFGQFYSGHYNDIEAALTLKADGYATLQMGTNIIRGHLPQGEFSENVYFTRLNVYLTPDLGMTNYFQYDDISNSIGYNGRIFWQIRPGNTLYLVYNNNIARGFLPDNRFSLKEDQVILKVQMSIRF